MALYVLLVLLFQSVRALETGRSNRTGPMVPAVIVFGDSIVDPGNNNVLKTTVKCNFPPYGQDFIAHKPTGRFPNGRIPSDLIGARKIAYVSLPPMGCVPSQRTLGGGILRKCDSARNQAAIFSNSEMRQATERIQREHNGTKIVYMDVYSILLDLIQRPSSYVFEETTKGCCGTGNIEATLLCNSKTTSTCPDVLKYVFWDSYHPTERAYKIILDQILQRYLSELV